LNAKNARGDKCEFPEKREEGGREKNVKQNATGTQRKKNSEKQDPRARI